MLTEGFEQWFKGNKNFISPLSEWNKVTTDMCRRAAQQNVEIMGEQISRFSDQLKRLSSVKKPEDFFTLQKECLNEDITAYLECMQKLMQITLTNMEECTKLCTSIHQEPTAKTTEKTGKRDF